MSRRLFGFALGMFATEDSGPENCFLNSLFVYNNQKFFFEFQGEYIFLSVRVCS